MLLRVLILSRRKGWHEINWATPRVLTDPAFVAQVGVRPCSVHTLLRVLCMQAF